LRPVPGAYLPFLEPIPGFSAIKRTSWDFLLDVIFQNRQHPPQADALLNTKQPNNQKRLLQLKEYI
jgi:hypothetical protein